MEKLYLRSGRVGCAKKVWKTRRKKGKVAGNLDLSCELGTDRAVRTT